MPDAADRQAADTGSARPTRAGVDVGIPINVTLVLLWACRETRNRGRRPGLALGASRGSAAVRPLHDGVGSSGVGLDAGSRATQRARLLRAMTHVAARDGYAAASIAKVIADARVSRPTFYEYFADKDDCFLAAQLAAAQVLVEQVDAAIAQGPPSRAPQSAIAAMLQFAAREQPHAQFLMCELPAGGPRSLDQRDALVASIAARVDQARGGLAGDERSPDLPVSAMVGGVMWLLAPGMRSREDLGRVTGELERWVDRYSRPVAEHRWASLQAGSAPPPSAYISELPSHAPTALGPGRPGISRGEVARNQRERIMYATAEVAARRGFNAATLGEIAAAAHVDARVLGAHFADKEQAFLAAHEFGFQHLMAVAASAFFSARSWPERAWEGILAGAQFQATHPELSHMLYVQSYAIGAEALERVNRTHAAFTLFLHEGNEHAAKPVSPLAMEAIVAASFEIVYQLSRQDKGEAVPRLVPHGAYLCLAPFLGPEAAETLIDEKMRGGAREAR